MKLTSLLVLTLAMLHVPAHALPQSAVTPSAGPREETPLAAKLRAGYEALAKQDFSKADGLFKDAATLDPKSPLPALGLAESARIRNDASGAQTWLKKALDLGPNNAQVLTAWARWNYSRKDYKQAEEFWNKAVVADPKGTVPLIDLGDLYFNVRGKPDKAAEFYRKAVALEPSHGGAHHALGMVALATRDLPKAIAEFDEAAKLSPQNPLPLQGLARAYSAKNDPANAIAALDRALAVQPGYYPARLDKGDLLLVQGKNDAALAEYAAVAKAQPKVAAAQMKIGMAQQQAGNRSEAMAAYQKAVDIDPGAALAYNNLAWLAVERKEQHDKALEWANKAVALLPSEPAVQDTLGWVLYKRGETDKALDVLQKLVDGPGKKFAEAHYHLGLVYADKGRKKEAGAALRKALEVNPKFAQASEVKAQLAKLEGK